MDRKSSQKKVPTNLSTAGGSFSNCVWQAGSRKKQGQVDLGQLEPFTDLPPGSVMVEASLGAQLGPLHAPSGPAETATNYGSFCSSKQVTQGH